MNLYAYAGNNPIGFRDPFGLRALDDITYDMYGREISRTKRPGPDRYFLEYQYETYKLDRALQKADRPYVIFENPAALDRTASTIARFAPKGYDTKFKLALHSWKNGLDLDFKKYLNPRSLYNAGNRMYVHHDKVANAAWGNYVAREGFDRDVVLWGANMQGALVGGEDPLDQEFITRGWELWQRSH